MGQGLSRFLLSSLGKKFVMAVTGFMLVGFVVMHLAGNLTLYGAADGEKFIDYADGMHSFGPALYVGELMLVLLFGVHVWTAFQLTKQNRNARPQGYAKNANFGESTVSSRSMFITGAVVLGFLIIHLANFRFRRSVGIPDSNVLYQDVKDVLSSPLWAPIYIIGSLAVGLHLSHGFRSAFQSLGVNHSRLNKLATGLGIFLAIVIGLGFASFPIVFMMIHS